MVRVVDVTWFLIRSSHAIRFTSRGGAPKAYCGRWGAATTTVYDQMPFGKSCETCLRIVAKQADA